MAQESWQLEKQEDTSCQPPDGPSLCINNCGFFGTPATRNFCSRCFNDVVLKVKASTVAKPATEKASISDTASWIDGASVGRLADKSTSDKDAVSDTASWIDGSSVGVAYCGRPSAKSNMEKGAVSDSASRIEGFSVGIADLGRPASKSTTKKGAVSDTASRIDGSSVGIAASGSQVANTEVSSAETVSCRRDVAGGEFSATSGQQPRQQTPDRCGSCRKRVRLAGFKCRCGDLFCSLHRYSETHNCSYDYKAAGREAIAYANPVVKARKIDKI